MRIKHNVKRLVAAVGTVLAYAITLPIGFEVGFAFRDAAQTHLTYDPSTPIGALPKIAGIGLVSAFVYFLIRYISIREIPHPAHYFIGFIFLFGFGHILAQSLIVDLLTPSSWWLNGSGLGVISALVVAGIAGYTIHTSASRGLGNRLIKLGAEVRSS